jgi:hypothetical protein
MLAPAERLEPVVADYAFPPLAERPCGSAFTTVAG